MKKPCSCQGTQTNPMNIHSGMVEVEMLGCTVTSILEGTDNFSEGCNIEVSSDGCDADVSAPRPIKWMTGMLSSSVVQSGPKISRIAAACARVVPPSHLVQRMLSSRSGEPSSCSKHSHPSLVAPHAQHLKVWQKLRQSGRSAKSSQVRLAGTTTEIALVSKQMSSVLVF